MLFAFLICVLVFSAVVTPTLTHTKKTKVIILGAGISGAGASSALTSAGITDFIVLEAQSVIGGRMKQGQISGVNVEVGANWVEGIGGAQVNPIWTFAQQLNLTVTNTDFGDAIILNEDGVRENETVMSEFLEKLEQTESLVKERERKGLEDISVRTALHLEGWRATTPSHDLAECMMIEQQFAGNVDLLSASYTLHEGTFQDFGEETRFIIDSRGYKSIPEFVFREANATEKIVFGTTVIEIIYNEEGVVVKTSNGDIYEGDYLISTVSLGVYQAEQIKFTPPLPDWKVEALFKFKMQTYTKIFLDFPSNFWSDNQFTYFASNEKGYYPEWENLMAAGFFSEYVQEGHHLVLTSITGDQSRRVERMTDEEIKDEIMEVLQKMYPGIEIPRPRDILVPRWGQNPLFFGSFTNWPIGMSTSSWKNLVAPLNRRVFFAGEMSSLFYYGYVHGGYLAGIEQAENVAACILDKCHTFEYYPNGLKAAVQEAYIL